MLLHPTSLFAVNWQITGKTKDEASKQTTTGMGSSGFTTTVATNRARKLFNGEQFTAQPPPCTAGVHA